jgi:hypothetical protein
MIKRWNGLSGLTRMPSWIKTGWRCSSSAQSRLWSRHQYGGTAFRQGTVQSYLVPIFLRDALVRLRRLFGETLRVTGIWRLRPARRGNLGTAGPGRAAEHAAVRFGPAARMRPPP